MSFSCWKIQTSEGTKIVRVGIVNFYGNIVLDSLIMPNCLE